MNAILRYVILLGIFCSTILSSDELKKVDIVSYSPYLLPNENIPYKYTYIREHFDVSFTYDLYQYVKNFQGDYPNLQKIIFFDYCQDPNTIKLPKSKLVCFKWEAIKIPMHFYDFYDRVYTFDDDLIDNKKFFKFYYPVLQPRVSHVPSFAEKNLCAMVAGHWIPERIKILDFFATKPKDALHVYGLPPVPYYHHEMNKGKIPGFYSGPQKLETLKNYRFCICFENTHTTPGYITEKIFDVFASGCVPIYWGPANIESYIPTNCYIDYQKFKNDEEMYQFITSMTEHEYDQYMEYIRQFLQSEKAYLFSQEHFDQLLYEAVIY